MPGGRAVFEVQALRAGRWVSEELRETESAARSLVAGILANPQVSGVRIIKNWTRADGIITENEVYKEMRREEPRKLTINPIDEAPLCQSLADVYRQASRAVIERLLRRYLEQVFLTPSEMLHNHRALQRVQEIDTLYPPAVDRVATIQARKAGLDQRQRRDELFSLVGRASQRARKTEEVKLPTITGSDFAKLFENVAGVVAPAEVAYSVRTVLSRDLIEYRSWLGKLDRLAGLVRADYPDEVLAALDEVIADLVAIPSALQEILGYRRNLAHALCALADLYEHGETVEKSDSNVELGAIGPLIASGRLAETRQALLDCLVQQLAGSQPLSRNEPSAEKDGFRMVTRRMLRPTDLLGGPATAAALTRRHVLFLEGGGKRALRDSVGGVLSFVDELQERIVYLVALAASELGEGLQDIILKDLRALLGNADINQIVPPAWAPTDKLRRVKGVFDMVNESAGLPADERTRLADMVDDMVAVFIDRERIIAKLDDPSAPLRDRATRLVDFCAAGLLPDGRSLRVARDRVVRHLRRPNFDQVFLEGVDPEHHAEALRDFHQRLERAGIR